MKTGINHITKQNGLFEKFRLEIKLYKPHKLGGVIDNNIVIVVPIARCCQRGTLIDLGGGFQKVVVLYMIV